MENNKDAEFDKVEVQDGQVETGIEYNEVTADDTVQDAVNEDNLLNVEGAEFEVPEDEGGNE